MSAAEAAAVAEIKEHIENDGAKDYISDEIESLAEEEFKSDRMEQRINRRVDAGAFGRPGDDRLA